MMTKIVEISGMAGTGTTGFTGISGSAGMTGSVQLSSGLVVLILAGIFVLITLITIYRDGKRQKAYRKTKIRRQWGMAPEREYSYEEFASIGNYAKRKIKEQFFVDGITWNDLDMDRVFMLMNNTMSSCGEDYLYYMLKTPAFSQEVLDERNRLSEYFRNHEQERQDLQMLLAEVGKTPGMSISDYIYRLNDVKESNTLKHRICCGLGIASVVSLFIAPLPGLMFLILMLCINIGTYYKSKGEIEIYLRCFQCMLRLLQVSDKLALQTDVNYADYTFQIKEAKNALAGFRRGSFLVTSAGQVSGNIADAILDFFKMFLHIDLIKFNSMLRALRNHIEDMEVLYENVGVLDSMIAVASFKEFLPYWTRGAFKEKEHAYFSVKDLYHPLVNEPVANSLQAKRGILLTGSNASGKSTFLKTIAINAILAQTVDLSVSHGYEAPFLKVMTSMALKDDLEAKESYYIVEIKSLKRILDESKKEVPLLCIVDEVLRGTNTIERISASSRILKELAKPHVLSFAATHDIELTYILEQFYDNFHFEEEVQEHDVVFNYLLKTGRAGTRNAIKLLDMIGYDKQIIADAKQEAKEFEEKGVWTNYVS